jgi:hypothetical protein
MLKKSDKGMLKKISDKGMLKKISDKGMLKKISDKGNILKIESMICFRLNFILKKFTLTEEESLTFSLRMAF